MIDARFVLFVLLAPLNLDPSSSNLELTRHLLMTPTLKQNDRFLLLGG